MSHVTMPLQAQLWT